MPGAREDEICQTALQLLAELCSIGAVESEHCRDFVYYLRDRARPRLAHSGTRPPAACALPRAVCASRCVWCVDVGVLRARCYVCACVILCAVDVGVLCVRYVCALCVRCVCLCVIYVCSVCVVMWVCWVCSMHVVMCVHYVCVIWV